MLVFPRTLLRESSVSAYLVYTTIGPSGATLHNVAPVVSVDGGGLWMLELNSVRLRTPDQIRLWKQMVAAMDGGVTPIEVSMCESRYAPFPGTVYEEEGVPFDDDALFDDDVGFYQPVIVGTVSGSHALRATQLTLEFQNISTVGLQGGEYFSIDHPVKGKRMYQVIKVTGTATDPIITIRPPLREAVANGAFVDFDRPGFVAQLASPDSGRLTLDLRRTATPSIAFIEAFPPEL